MIRCLSLQSVYSGTALSLILFAWFTASTRSSGPGLRPISDTERFSLRAPLVESLSAVPHMQSPALRVDNFRRAVFPVTVALTRVSIVVGTLMSKWDLGTLHMMPNLD